MLVDRAYTTFSYFLNVGACLGTLFTVAFPIAVFCSFWFVIIKPLSALTAYFGIWCEYLSKGAILPYTLIRKMLMGESLFSIKDAIDYIESPIRRGKQYYEQLCTPERKEKSKAPTLPEIEEEDEDEQPEQSVRHRSNS